MVAFFLAGVILKRNAWFKDPLSISQGFKCFTIFSQITINSNRINSPLYFDIKGLVEHQGLVYCFIFLIFFSARVY
jgi:hypothetical protein